MNRKQIEAYRFYRGLYPSALLLFHPGGGYVAMSDDARRAAVILGNDTDIVNGTLTLPDDDFGVISKLGAAGVDVRIINYRNDDGERDYPDVERLKREREEDF